MATSISIKGKNQAQETTTATVNYVNPNATNGQLVELAEKLNALTTNTIDDVTKITKTSLTDTPRTNRTITLNPSSVAFSELSRNADIPTRITITFTGDGIPTFTQNTTRTGNARVFCTIDKANDEWRLCIVRDNGDGSETGEITITVPETDTYYSATATLTIT